MSWMPSRGGSVADSEHSRTSGAMTGLNQAMGSMGSQGQQQQQQQGSGSSKCYKMDGGKKSAPFSGNRMAMTKKRSMSGSEEDMEDDSEFIAKRTKMMSESDYERLARKMMEAAPYAMERQKIGCPLRYAARCEEVRWEWQDERSGRLARKELIGGGKNSDLDRF